ARDRDHAARSQERMVAEARGWALQEGAARHREASDDDAPVVLGKTSRRAAGRVVAAVFLALEKNDRRESSQLVRGARAGDSTTDNDHIHWSNSLDRRTNKTYHGRAIFA